MSRLAIAAIGAALRALAADRDALAGDDVVDVAIAGDAAEAAALSDTIRELLARLHVGVVPAGAGGGARAIAHVTIDLTGEGAAIATVTDATSGELRLHRAVTREGSKAVVREEIAQKVQAAVEAELLERQARASPPPGDGRAGGGPAPGGARPAANEPPPERPVSLDVGVLGGAGGFASQVGPAFRVGGEATLALTGSPRPFVSIAAAYALPFESSDARPVIARAAVTSGRALFGVEVIRLGRAAIDAGAGGGLDVLHVEGHSAVLPRSHLLPASERVDAIVSGAVSLHVALTSDVSVTVIGLADLDLAARRYVLSRGPEADDVFVPWRLRPTVLAGLSLRALGGARGASDAR